MPDLEYPVMEIQEDMEAEGMEMIMVVVWVVCLIRKTLNYECHPFHKTADKMSVYAALRPRPNLQMQYRN